MNDTKSGTGIFVASAIWAAAIVASAYLCSMLLSIPIILASLTLSIFDVISDPVNNTDML